MNDQRIKLGSALDGEDACDRTSVEGVCAQPVDGFRRKSDEAAAGQRTCGALDVGADRAVHAIREIVRGIRFRNHFAEAKLPAQ